MYLFREEIKLNFKSFIIWAASIGGLLLACIMIFDSMGDTADQLSDAFANMGAFTAAFGMEKVSIGTLSGYFAVEVSVICSLGTAMYAALTGAGMVAKEEEIHTCEFLSSLPMTRNRVITEKLLALLVLVISMQAVCAVCSSGGFAYYGELDENAGKLILYHFRALLMNTELALISFMLSSVLKKRPIGASLGIVLLCYFGDIIGKISEQLKDIRLIIPFSYCDASDIFSGETIPAIALISAASIIILSLAVAYTVYNKRDLAA